MEGLLNGVKMLGKADVIGWVLKVHMEEFGMLLEVVSGGGAGGPEAG